MKATGIVRRIDDLGRVVIPKEIRRTMRIRDGDPLEIFTNKDGEVIFKKYSPMGELNTFSAQLCETLTRTTSLPSAIADRDMIISASGAAKREFFEKRVSPQLEHIMEERSMYKYVGGEKLPVCEDTETESGYIGIAVPIIVEGDVSGAVLFTMNGDGAELPGETEQKLAQTIAGFLGKQMET